MTIDLKNEIVYPACSRAKMLAVEREVLKGITTRKTNGDKAISYMLCGIRWLNAIDRLCRKGLIQYNPDLFGYVRTNRTQADRRMRGFYV